MHRAAGLLATRRPAVRYDLQCEEEAPRLGRRRHDQTELRERLGSTVSVALVCSVLIVMAVMAALGRCLISGSFPSAAGLPCALSQADCGLAAALPHFACLLHVHAIAFTGAWGRAARG